MTRHGYTGPPGERRKYVVPDVTRYRRGGIGVVFTAALNAEDETGSGDKVIGLKMLTGVDEARFTKLLKRSEKLRDIDHPNIARHLECFIGPTPTDQPVDDDEYDQFFAAHHWVDGEPLLERIAESDPRDILCWGGQIATALTFLHSRPDGGFAHRDVHARNIIIRPDDTACLIDFDTILWGDTADSNIINLSNLSPGPQQPGLVGAKRGDVQSLAVTLLRGFARDTDSTLDLEALIETATITLNPSARDPEGAVRYLVECLESPPGSATDLTDRLQRHFDKSPGPFRAVRRLHLGRMAIGFAALGLVAALIVFVPRLAIPETGPGNDAVGAGDSAAAEPVEANGVLASDLPTVAQIAEIYPDYEGGKRELAADRGQSSEFEAEECYDWMTGFRSATGQIAMYSDHEGESPFFYGSDGVTVSAYQFATESNAKKAQALFASFVADCEGFHRPESEGDSTYEYRPLDAPRGYRGLRSVENAPLLDDVTGKDILDERAGIEIVTTKGLFLIVVRVDNDEGMPDIDSGIKVAKLARAMAG